MTNPGIMRAIVDKYDTAQDPRVAKISRSQKNDIKSYSDFIDNRFGDALYSLQEGKDYLRRMARLLKEMGDDRADAIEQYIPKLEEAMRVIDISNEYTGVNIAVLLNELEEDYLLD